MEIKELWIRAVEAAARVEQGRGVSPGVLLSTASAIVERIEREYSFTQEVAQKRDAGGRPILSRK